MPYARLALEADRVPPERPGQLDEPELVALLEQAARQLNVRACELLLRRVPTAKPDVDEDDAFAEVDRIAEQRRRRVQREA